MLHQGDGGSGTGWNYYDSVYATDPEGPWDVGSGSEELNGTYDMIGNNMEWMESPFNDPYYHADSTRVLHGGSWNFDSFHLAAPTRNSASSPPMEINYIGFRVASIPHVVYSESNSRNLFRRTGIPCQTLIDLIINVILAGRGGLLHVALK